jgi:phosphoribosylamine--glycine ligase
LFCPTDGKTTKYYQLLKITNALARDTGLNTGGMGGFTSSLCRCGFDGKIETRIVKPTMMVSRKTEFVQRVCFIGLINVNNEPIVIEYNVRMGDPETEVVIPRLKTDLVELFWLYKTRRN